MTKFFITLPGNVAYEILASGRAKAVKLAIVQHYGDGPVKVVFSRYMPGMVVYEACRKGKPAIEVFVHQ